MNKKKRASRTEILACFVVTFLLAVLMLGTGLHNLSDPYEYRTAKGVLRSFETEQTWDSHRHGLDFDDNLMLNIDGRILNLVVPHTPGIPASLSGTEYSMPEIQEILLPYIDTVIEYTYRHGSGDTIVQLSVGDTEIVNREREASQHRSNALGFCGLGIFLAAASLSLLIFYVKMPKRRKEHARSRSRRASRSCR